MTRGWVSKKRVSMHADVNIEVVVLLEKATGETKVFFLSTFAPGDQAMELFVSQSGHAFALYHMDAYSDKTLKNRRNTNNMLLPGQPTERLTLAGQVWHKSAYNAGDYIELSRSSLNLRNVPVDEK
jgi:hypothetical protein